MTEQQPKPPTKLVDLANLIKMPDPVMRIIKRPVESVLGLTHINKFYASIQHLPMPEREARFFDLCIKGLNLLYEVPVDELSSIPKSGPLVIVANHPHGLADGIRLADMLSHVRSDFRLLANEQLKMCPELLPWIIQVNPFQTQAARRRNIAGLRQAMALLEKGGCLITFPAGSASTFSFEEERVIDGPWNPNVCSLIRKCGAGVLPVHLSGRNSLLFQTVGMLKREARVAFLPREIKRNGKLVQKITIGNVSAPDEFADFGSLQEMAAELKRLTYGLANHAGR